MATRLSGLTRVLSMIVFQISLAHQLVEPFGAELVPTRLVTDGIGVTSAMFRDLCRRFSQTFPSGQGCALGSHRRFR